MHPIGPEVQPQLLGAHPGLVHHLQLNTPPVHELLIVQPRGVTGENHRAGQALQQPHIVRRLFQEEHVRYAAA
jgi:hypothetical protein